MAHAMRRCSGPGWLRAVVSRDGVLSRLLSRARRLASAQATRWGDYSEA